MSKILFCGMLTLMLMGSLTNQGQEEHGNGARYQQYATEITYNLHLIGDLCKGRSVIATQRRVIDSLYNRAQP